MWARIIQSGRPNCAPIPEEKAPRSRRRSKNLNGERIRPGQPVSETRSVRKSPCRIRKALQVHRKGRPEGNAIEAVSPIAPRPPRIIRARRCVAEDRAGEGGASAERFATGPQSEPVRRGKKGIAEVCFHVGIHPRIRGRGVRPVHSRGGWSVGYVAFCVRDGCRPSRY